MGDLRILLADSPDGWAFRGLDLFHEAGIENVHVAPVNTASDLCAALQRAIGGCLIISPTVPQVAVSALLAELDRGAFRDWWPVILIREEPDAHTTASAGWDQGDVPFLWLNATELRPDTLRLAVLHACFRRQAANELREKRLELSQVTQAAARQSDELQLVKVEAQRASVAKDEFLAALSHELRTPLTPILSLVSSMLSSEYHLDTDVKESFAIIQRNIEIEARFIDDLLDLTQIASGRLAMEHRPVDVHDCIRHAMKVCADAFDDRRVTPVLRLDAATSTVIGDSPRMHQVIWNLLKNAVKFTPPGGKVTIATSLEDNCVTIAVEDTGIGIDPARLQGIFTMFGGQSRMNASTGPGLGLAITRAIVEAHGGVISAHSGGANQGATFRVHLPAAAPEQRDDSDATDFEAPSFHGRTVLVVEDHEDTRRVLSRALRRRGFGVTVADGVESACEQFLQNHPDLVICDLGLPDGTGWDALRRLRELGSVKAIAVSGFGMDEDLRKSREAGFVAHLIKPLSFPLLENVLATVLGDTSTASVD